MDYAARVRLNARCVRERRGEGQKPRKLSAANKLAGLRRKVGGKFSEKFRGAFGRIAAARYFGWLANRRVILHLTDHFFFDQLDQGDDTGLDLLKTCHETLRPAHGVGAFRALLTPLGNNLQHPRQVAANFRVDPRYAKRGAMHPGDGPQQTQGFQSAVSIDIRTQESPTFFRGKKGILKSAIVSFGQGCR